MGLMVRDMTESFQSQINNLWTIVPLDKVLISLESGKRPKGGVKDIKTGIPSLGGEHLNSDGGFKFENIRYVPEEFALNMLRGQIKQDDILIVKDGATTGKVSFVNRAFPYNNAVVNEHVFICRISKFVDPKFIFYFLFSETGQKRILENFKKIQQQLKIYRQAVLKAAFEGKLTLSWRKSLDNLCDKKNLTSRVESEIEENDLIYSEQVNHPEEWLLLKAEKVSDFITKGTTPKKTELHPDKGEVPFIKVYNLTFNGSLDFSIDPFFVTSDTHSTFLKRSIVYLGDVLMNIVGPPLGKVSIVPDHYREWNINQAIVRFRTRDFIRNKFLAYYLLSENTLRRLMSRSKATAGQFNLTLQICRELEIPICTLNEQDEIVEEIESRLSICDELEKTIEQNLILEKSLRQSILKKAFEGKLVPQDPNDEPAELLLEKIKLEKEKLANSSQTKTKREKVTA